MLARYQIRRDAPFSLQGEDRIRGRSEIGSIEGVYQVEPGEQVTLKYAFRSTAATSDGVTSSARTHLWLFRATRDLSERWNWSAEARFLSQPDLGASQLGLGVEVGYVPQDDVVVGIGYNFVGEDDSDLSGGRRWAKGWYVRYGLKFDESLLAGVWRHAGPQGGEAPR